MGLVINCFSVELPISKTQQHSTGQTQLSYFAFKSNKKTQEGVIPLASHSGDDCCCSCQVCVEALRVHHRGDWRDNGFFVFALFPETASSINHPLRATLTGSALVPFLDLVYSGGWRATKETLALATASFHCIGVALCGQGHRAPAVKEDDLKV